MAQSHARTAADDMMSSEASSWAHLLPYMQDAACYVQTPSDFQNTVLVISLFSQLFQACFLSHLKVRVHICLRLCSGTWSEYAYSVSRVPACV